MTRAVVFDLDGTLIDSLPDIANAANALLVEEGRPALPQAQVAGFVGHGERVFLQRLIAAAGLEPDAFDALLPRFVQHYVKMSADTRLFEGAREAMDRLRAEGFVLGLCTNKPRAPLDEVLVAARLTDVFDAVIAGDDLPVRKPDPAPLHELIARLGATAVVYVGDSPVDAETAARAGVPFVLFTEGIRTVPIEEMPHDAAFSDFRDLPGLCAERLVAA